MPHSQSFPTIPILNRIKPIYCIDIYFVKICSILSSHLRLGIPRFTLYVGITEHFENTPTFFQSGYISCPSWFSILYYSNSKVPHCETFFTRLFHPMGSKYAAQKLAFKYLCSLIKLREHVSQPYCKTANINVFYIFILNSLKRNREGESALTP